MVEDVPVPRLLEPVERARRAGPVSDLLPEELTSVSIRLGDSVIKTRVFCRF